MNMLDYLEWRGDLTFSERGLNEVDNLIFSSLSYLNMRSWISEDLSHNLTIGELYQACESAGVDTSHIPADPMRLLRYAAATERFRNVRVCCYCEKYDTEEYIQFAAVTFLYAQGKAYIAFRGTDNTLTGWREDCNFSYLEETPGQLAAAEYLNFVSSLLNVEFVVGGHSKGGNFAVYASAFCKEEVREHRIVKIYSNDGPGFNNAIAESANYMAILEKLEKIIPEFSIVGILLSSKAKRKVIKSNAKGIDQHNPYSWLVNGASFEKADNRSFASVLLDGALSSWISSLKAEDKQLIIDSFFDALESSGAETIRDVKNQKKEALLSVFRSLIKIDPKRRAYLMGTLGKLVSGGKEIAIQEAQKEAERRILETIKNMPEG